MSLIQEITNNMVCTRDYQLDYIKTNLDAIKWISKLADIPGLEISFVQLSDLNNRTDEGSDNLQLVGPIRIEKINNELSERSIEIISVMCEYFGKMVVLGVDLRNFNPFISFSKKDFIDIKTLEITMNLI